MIRLFLAFKNKNERSKDLNHDLSLISKWSFKWKMLFKSDPTKPAQEIIFSRKKNDSDQPNIFLMIYQSKELQYSLDSI